MSNHKFPLAYVPTTIQPIVERPQLWAPQPLSREEIERLQDWKKKEDSEDTEETSAVIIISMC